MRNETKCGTNNQRSGNAGRYKLLAVMTGLFLFGGLLMIEHLPLISLAANVVFCTVCAAMLLYALMKLDVMEFQQGSFWDRLNQYVNREKTAAPAGRRAGKKAARSTVYAMILNK